MTYYIYVEKDKCIGTGSVKCLNSEVLNIKVPEEIYNSYIEDKDKYVYSDGEIIENPEYEKILEEKEKNLYREELIEQLNELDSKRIRAVCESSIKESSTGETWLDYYNNQVLNLRTKLNSL